MRSSCRKSENKRENQKGFGAVYAGVQREEEKRGSAGVCSVFSVAKTRIWGSACVVTGVCSSSLPLILYIVREICGNIV